jgi:hypothetical protein
VLSKPVVSCPIVGATKPAHLQDAFAALDVKLTEDEITALEEPYTPQDNYCGEAHTFPGTARDVGPLNRHRRLRSAGLTRRAAESDASRPRVGRSDRERLKPVNPG